MMVMEGESFELTNGKWKKIEVQVTVDDLIRQLVEWKIPDASTVAPKLSPTLAYDILSVLAQRLIVARAYNEGAYTRDEAATVLTNLHRRTETQRTTLAGLLA